MHTTRFFPFVVTLVIAFDIGFHSLLAQEISESWDSPAIDSAAVLRSRTTEVNRPQVVGTYYETVVPDTLDLAQRAKFGVNHFTSSISEEDGFEMYWGVQPLGLSPTMMEMIGHEGEPKLGCSFGEFNPPYMVMWWPSLMACQVKCMEALAMERLMSGSVQHLEREAGMLEELASYVGEDGIYWVPKTLDRPWLGPKKLRPYANTHGQGRMMRAMIRWYQYTGNPMWKELVDRMVDGLDHIAVHKEDYAYVPVFGWIDVEYFRSCYTRQGWKDTTEPTHEKFGEEGSLFNHQGHIPGALACWYDLTGNKKALRLSGELVRFYTKPQFWSDWEKGEYPGVVGAEHAHWQGHFHGYINVLRAILEYAVAVNDPQLKQFVRDGYEWTRQSGFARIGYVGDGQGCGCGRLIGLAVKLTDVGVGDYWEDVDLYIRNHGVELQFTPEDISFLETLGKGKPAPSKHRGMATENVLQTTVGAYSNHVAPYKCSSSLCCSPHGNMGLFYAWDGALRHKDGIVTVNLLLNRASPWIDVDSYLPYEGKVILKNKKAKNLFVRIPLWVDKAAVTCRIGQRQVKPNWFGNHLRFNDLAKGKNITIAFPMAERTERWTIPKPTQFTLTIGADTSYTCRFKGNTLIEIDPPLSPGSWIYQNRVEKYKADKAPMKKVIRYVTEQKLPW